MDDKNSLLKYLFSGCIFYEILFSKKAFIGGRRSLVNNISRGKYEPIPEALIIQFGDIIPSLLSVIPQSRFNASEVLEILEAPDKSRELYDTPVVIQSETRNPSEDMLAAIKVEPIALVKTEHISQGALSPPSFGAAWDLGAMAEPPGIEAQFSSRLRSSDIENGWNIGQSGLSAPITIYNHPSIARERLMPRQVRRLAANPNLDALTQLVARSRPGPRQVRRPKLNPNLEYLDGLASRVMYQTRSESDSRRHNREWCRMLGMASLGE